VRRVHGTRRQLTDRFDLGARQVSDQQLAARPATAPGFHGPWNYTLHPASTCSARAPGGSSPARDDPGEPAARPPARRPRCAQAALARPAVTGIPATDLAALTAALATGWNAGREAASYLRRGGPRRRQSPACQRCNGHLDLTGHTLVTLIHHHLALPRYLIAPLSGAGPDAIADAINLTSPLLNQHPPPLQHAARAAVLRQLCQHAQTSGISLPAKIKAACY
jgi:hypothetical protein